MNIAIVGAGNGGTNVINSLSKIEDVNIKVVVDTNDNAPGIYLAKQLGIRHAASIDAIDAMNVDLIIEATGNENVENILCEKFTGKCKVIDSNGARLIMSLVKRDVQTLDKMNSQIDAIKSASDIIQEQLFEITRAIDNTSAVSEKLMGYTQSSINYINESDKIIKYVNSIASQTKILGINAKIEAARAGELGKGFSVVANEVQKLADSSESFAKEINSILRKLADDIQSIKLEANQLEMLSNTQVSASENVNTAVSELAAQIK